MTTTITVKPNELGTAVITMSFTDEDDAAVTPTSLQWQLMKSDGTIVNDRAFADNAFTASAGEATVILSGDDLAMFGDKDNGRRVFSIQGEYDSTAGVGLPLKDEVNFRVQKLLGQTDQES